MKKTNKIAIFLAGALVVGVISAYGYSIIIDSGKTIVGSEVCLVSYDKNQLVNEATAIVSGKVISKESQTDFEGFPATDYIIKVSKIYRGNPGAEVEVRTAGGENENMIYEPDEDLVKFKVGEIITLFLTDDKGTRPDKNDFGYYVLGGYQGKFKDVDGVLKSNKFEFDVANFAKELKNIEKENKEKGLKKTTEYVKEGL